MEVIFILSIIIDTTITVNEVTYVFSAYKMIFFIGFVFTFIGFLIIFLFYHEVDIEEETGLERA